MNSVGDGFKPCVTVQEGVEINISEYIEELHEQINSLLTQVEALQAELEDKAVFDNPEDCWASHRALEQQVEELSKYPEEAVKKMYCMIVKDMFYENVTEEEWLGVKDKLAAIWKDEQGVGK